MTNKEISQAIRKALKEAGYDRKDISVTSKYVGYSSRFDVIIKNPMIKISDVEKIADQWESVDRDPATGEILAGGNDYVFVKYEYGILEAAAADLIPIAENVFNNPKYDGKAICEKDGKRLHINIRDKWERIITEFDDVEVYTYKPNKYNRSAKDLAVAVWQFKNLGTIYV